MRWNQWVREIHRWLSIAFTAIVVGIFVMLGAGMEPAYWVYLSPLPPLFLLLFSGLYLFVLPHALKWRGARRGRQQQS